LVGSHAAHIHEPHVAVRCVCPCVVGVLHRETKRDTGRHRETQGGTERHRKA